MYDLAVYLPGGVVALILAHQFVQTQFGISLPVFGERDSSAVGQAIVAVAWLSASYLAGHIIAFTSSYLVEKFVHYKLGYPSDIWLESESKVSEGSVAPLTYRKIFQENLEKKRDGYWVRRLIGLLQLPALLPLLAIRLLMPFGFYTPKLPYGLKGKVSEKFDSLATGVQLRKNTRWEKLVEHYVANNCPAAYTRLYNYLVIYGALRTLALLVLIYLWMLIVHDVIDKIVNGFRFDLSMTLYFNGLTIVYVCCLMAFAKFNRRFFEESILAFLFGDGKALEMAARDD